MTNPAGSRLYRLAVPYRLGDDGLLVPEQLPAAKVPVGAEGALYRRLAALANADDAAIVAFASRYGPLGPTARVAVPDQPRYLWALDGSVRSSVRQMRLLRAWIAHGGRTPIPGHVAPVAHMLASYAEADDGTARRLLELLLDRGAPPSDEERAGIEARLDRFEHRAYCALSRRAAQLNTQFARGDAHVRVDVPPKAARRLPDVAQLIPLLFDKASESGGTSSAIPPGSLGRLATELRPYFAQDDLPLYPAEEDRQTLTALLLYRLQQVDAWPFPAGDLLGTFPRALWTLWQPVTRSRPQRRCAWLGCTLLLPVDAHGNRRHCDEHRREQHRARAARNRRRKALAPGRALPGAASPP